MAQAGLLKWLVIGVGAYLLLRPAAEEEVAAAPAEEFGVGTGPLGEQMLPPEGFLDYQRYAPQYQPKFAPMYRQRYPSS